MPRTRSLAWPLAASLAALLGYGADKYTGPVPPAPDVPYLLHADRLVATELAEAREESRKGETAYTIPGASSPARTPLAEPIFIMQSKQISPEQMELYRMEVRGGAREVTLAQKRRKSARRVNIQVTRLANNLYRIEADEPLENGQYALSPNGTNQVFCFEIY